ncbi:MAG: TolC family protein [Bacteroidales bacterium]|nr:TolC family protein [Bacteroidales bacterium]
MKQISKLLSISLFLFYFQSLAQDTWGLDRCISFALDNNIQIKKYELSTQMQSNQLKQAKISLAPSLNGSLSRNVSFGRSVDAYTNDFTEDRTMTDNYSISSSVTLFNGFQKINAIKKNQLDLQAYLSDLRKFKNDISLNVASSYLNVLFNLEILETSEAQLAITKLQVDRIQKLVDAGSLAQGDLLEIEAQVANEELAKVNYENQLAMSILNLKQLLELDTLNNFEIARPNVDIEAINLPPNASAIYDYAIKEMPEILSAEYKLRSYEKSLSIAKGGRSPQLSLGAGINSGYSDARMEQTLTGSQDIPYGYTVDASGTQLPTYIIQPTYDLNTKSFGDQLRDNRNTYVGLSLSIPIFNGWQVNTNISNSKINVLNAQYDLELEKKTLFKDIQQKYLDAISAQKKYIATKAALQSASESFLYTQKKYEVGLINSLDYNLAKNKVTKAQSDLLQAKYEFLFAVKILDFYQGKPIAL